MAEKTPGPILGHRPRGRPAKPEAPLPVAVWVPPEIAAAWIDVSLATLWRGVAVGKLTPPSYPTEKSPQFHLPTLDADMERARSLPAENAAGLRAARLAAVRREKRMLTIAAAAVAGAQTTSKVSPAAARHQKRTLKTKPAAANRQTDPPSLPGEGPAPER